MEKRNDNFIMRPTVDFCFKELMNNEKVRRGFISALLQTEPEKIKNTILLPTILLSSAEQDKMGILDVRVLMTDGTQMDLEMQVKQFEYWDERILFYICKMFAGQLKKGDSYGELQKCIHVSILDFIHFPEDNEFYRTIHFRDDKTGKKYTDKLELQILELKKLPREMTPEEEIVSWMKFFSGKSREEFADMAERNEYIGEAYHTLLELSADERKRLEYETREKALLDYNSQMYSAEKRGEKRGEERGEKRGREQVKKVFKLFISGKTTEEIAEFCNLPLEAVKKILE